MRGTGASVRPGDLIAARYELVSQCGSGAMGSVWEAKHVALGSSVAVKFLHPEFAASQDARRRFAREARVAAMLGERSRYVVRVTDYGLLDDRGPFLVMEYLQGEELAEKLRRVRRIRLFEAVEIVAQLCRALEVAHRAGVVHRDIKPQNVFLARPPTNMGVFVKLMDFGVAKLLDGVAEAHGPPHGTRIGAVIGTPAYMPPEQLLAQEIDLRSDLWAVAAMTYRMLTGELPFGTGTLTEIGLAIVNATPRRPSEIVPELPPAIDTWFERALAKSPADRFESATALATAFAAAAGVELSTALPRALHPTPLPSSESLPSSGVRLAAPKSSGTFRRTRRRRPVLLPLAIVLAVLVGPAAVTMLQTSSRTWLEFSVAPRAPTPSAAVVQLAAPSSEPARASGEPAPPLPKPKLRTKAPVKTTK